VQRHGIRGVPERGSHQRGGACDQALECVCRAGGAQGCTGEKKPRDHHPPAIISCSFRLHAWIGPHAGKISSASAKDTTTSEHRPLLAARPACLQFAEMVLDGPTSLKRPGDVAGPAAFQLPGTEYAEEVAIAAERVRQAVPQAGLVMEDARSLSPDPCWRSQAHGCSAGTLIVTQANGVCTPSL
jgi:hypothetical protein